MKAVIFGASGQDGVYLAALLQQKGYSVTGISRKSTDLRISNFEEVCALVKNLQPAYIFHLAANSTTRIDAWQENHETICTGSLNILEAVRLWSPATKVFLSGSGLQFVNNGGPIKETDDFFAGSAYAVSRIHTVYAARFYRQQGVKAYTGYFFTHDSPGRTERHINKKISETVKRIAGGSSEKLSIGDLSVKKEFGFAGDIVKGILTLVEQDTVFECVIGTGRAHSIEEWIDICFSSYGLRWQEHVETMPGFTAEYTQLVSDPATIFSLGWKPATDIHSLAKMMLA
jgi:GDPmannose 4,6-dehydratase